MCASIFFLRTSEKPLLYYGKYILFGRTACIDELTYVCICYLPKYKQRLYEILVYTRLFYLRTGRYTYLCCCTLVPFAPTQNMTPPPRKRPPPRKIRLFEQCGEGANGKKDLQPAHSCLHGGVDDRHVFPSPVAADEAGRPARPHLVRLQ